MVWGESPMRGKIWNVMVVPEEGGAVRSLRIPVRLLYISCAIAVLGLLSVATSVGVHIWNLQGLRTIRHVKKENTLLRAHLDGVNRSLEQLESQVREGERMERQARLLAGLDPIDAETRQLGVGGPLSATAPSETAADPALASTVETQGERLESLARSVSFQRRSFQETLGKLKGLGDQLVHTPSICPLRNRYIVSGSYGWRTDPFTGERAFHGGVDLRAESGTPVHATANGEVVFAGWNGDFGRSVRIRHGYGFETTYSHLEAIKIRRGQKVERGTVIGAVGSSGRSTGPHLHYEVDVAGRSKDPADFILTPRTAAD